MEKHFATLCSTLTSFDPDGSKFVLKTHLASLGTSNELHAVGNNMPHRHIIK